MYVIQIKGKNYFQFSSIYFRDVIFNRLIDFKFEDRIEVVFERVSFLEDANLPLEISVLNVNVSRNPIFRIEESTFPGTYWVLHKIIKSITEMQISLYKVRILKKCAKIWLNWYIGLNLKIWKMKIWIFLGFASGFTKFFRFLFMIHRAKQKYT